ncbi:MAG TPA: sulfite exporter TauE/SafE family protein [Rubrobacteraceae bacterium]|nr:sulfite exporter TauE/SafE family protein [Rubrobacteraceae bacterium]
MRNLVILALLGFVAQLVDGALGMAYGATSSTLLVAVGIAPALASTAVHLGEVGTTLVSGVSHWRFGNVDWTKIAWLAVPGGIGAFLGAVALSSISAEAAEPLVAVFLFGLGVYVLARFSFRRNERPVVVRPIAKKFLSPLGFVAGFLDAAGGGGWGRISTPPLLTTGRMEPRKIIGTVDTSEFVVAVCASLGFFYALSFAEVPWQVVGALLVGGVFAAPIAAYVVRILPTRILGTAVGGLILVTNMRTFLKAVGLNSEPAVTWSIYAVIVAIWLAAFAYAVVVVRREGERTPEGEGLVT